MKFINIIEDYKGYDKVFLAQVNLSKKEISLIVKTLELNHSPDDLETVKLLSELKEVEKVVKKQI